MKKILGVILALVMILVFTSTVFAAGGPTPGPVAGPGCFGLWRAGSVQVINGMAPGTNNAGALYFSVRAGDNATINAENRATCAGLP